MMHGTAAKADFTQEDVDGLSRKGIHCLGGGLYLTICRRRVRKWSYRFNVPGNTRGIELGSAVTVPLEEARWLAEETKTLVKFLKDQTFSGMTLQELRQLAASQPSE